MKSLQSILDSYASQYGPLGAKSAVSEEEEQRLISDLLAIQATNGKLVAVVAVLLVLLFGICVWTVISKGAEPNTAKAVLGLLGVSATGCIRWLLGLWREKTSIELLLRLAVSIKGDALCQVIKVLAAKAGLAAGPDDVASRPGDHGRHKH
ncbi:MAG: hypothetical protein HZA90_26550 [Verrucomicrobia bacterium]|nr:hypothetical protein [Verrucomicrobiota bacterium]